jgi:SAM-dependent methyltransferase
MTTDLFERAVKDYLRPYADLFNYPTLLNNHLDTSRFGSWVREVGWYRALTGVTVLSSGCGSAGDLLAFLQQGAAMAYGIEVDIGLARLARQRFVGTDFESAVHIDIYNGLTLPYAGNSVDIVFSMHVIEHTQDPERYLIEVCRVLKPGGIVFLDVPNRYYKYEQHTMIPYVHWPPTKLRNAILRTLLARPVSRRLSPTQRYQYATYINYHIPSPAHLLKVYRAVQVQYHLQLIEAYFHSYTEQRLNFRPYPAKYIIGRIRQATTFRLIIRKGSSD